MSEPKFIQGKLIKRIRVGYENWGIELTDKDVFIHLSDVSSIYRVEPVDGKYAYVAMMKSLDPVMNRPTRISFATQSDLSSMLPHVLK